VTEPQHRQAERLRGPPDNGQRDPWTHTLLADRIRKPQPLLKPYGRFGILYPAKSIHIFGPPESGKSTLADAEIIWHLEHELPVFYFDEDAGPDDVVSRLIALGADADRVDKYLQYYEPDDRQVTRRQDELHRIIEPFRKRTAHCDTCHVPTFGLVVFDAKVDFLVAEGLQENNEDSAKFFRTVRTLTEKDFTTFTIDHVPIAAAKDRSHAFARAGGAAAGKVDLAWRCDAEPHFSRQEDGTILLWCHKDRIGAIGRNAEVRIDVATVTAGGEGRIELDLVDYKPPSEAEADRQKRQAEAKRKPTPAEQKTLDVMQTDATHRWSKAEIAEVRGCAVQSLPMDSLVEKSYVEQLKDPESKRGAYLYQLVPVFKEDG
jgi:hypothetical protein